MPVHNPHSFSYEPKQAAEYSWTEEFEGRRLPIKVRVFYTPVDLAVTGIKARGKYNALALIGGNWFPFVDRGYEPSEPELKALVRAQMPTWKNTGVI
jgi:hypothetical protein